MLIQHLYGIPSLPYKLSVTKKGFREWYKYLYNEYLDIVICPKYKSLSYSITNRKGYAEDIRHSPREKESHRRRFQTIERFFADAKEKYGMRYTPYWELKRASVWVKLILP